MQAAVEGDQDSNRGPVLVIGASGAIGGAVARRVAESGRPVITHGREDGARLRSIGGAIGDLPPAGSFSVAGDFSILEEADHVGEAVRARTDRLSGLVFAAARPFRNKLTVNTDWSVFQAQIDSQLHAFHAAMTRFKPLLAANPGGARVVALSTEFVLGPPPIKTAPYVAAKAALTTYAKVLAQELLASGIRVHVLAPGMVRSALTADMPDEYLDIVADGMPEKRLTTAEDVADVCAFLLRPEADTLYGTVTHASRAARR